MYGGLGGGDVMGASGREGWYCRETRGGLVVLWCGREKVKRVVFDLLTPVLLVWGGLERFGPKD